MTITWKEEAEDKYLSTLEYLTDNFSLEVAIDLNQEVDKCTEYIANGLLKGAFSKRIQAYKVIIKKYNILIYRIDKNNLYIINFIATRTDHKLNQ